MKDNTKDEFKNYIWLLKKYLKESNEKIKSATGITKELLVIYIKKLEKEINIISKKVSSEEL